MGSAQRFDLPLSASDASEATWTANDLKQQAAARIAAHRERRLHANRRGDGNAHAPASPAPRITARSSSVAATVAARFAQSPSYRAFLAEQAQHAIDEAAREAESRAAEAEIAARTAEAIANAQQELLDELQSVAAFLDESPALLASPAFPLCEATAPVGDVSSGSLLTVRLYEDLGQTPVALHGNGIPGFGDAPTGIAEDAEEALALDEEIAFRHAPVIESHVNEPTVPLPANLLEFPRQLVAARRARPRFAEGPLREEDDQRNPQLRIFEVEAEQISTVPMERSPIPEWAGIWLEAHTVTDAVPTADTPVMQPAYSTPETAPARLRLIASMIDLGWITSAVVAFAGVIATMEGRLPTTSFVALAGVTALTVFFLAYYLLFFTFSEQTPGMRYARLGFCTFADQSPSRKALRRRILAHALAILPLGLGVLWSLLDDDRLGWHDRVSGMYPRAY